ncbi:unnamed protein product, partial [Didymodactylos carnosus]
MWLIFNYLHDCGACLSYTKSYEKFGHYAAGWSKYVQIGAVDCRVEDIICIDKFYPTWRIFCPLKNSTIPLQTDDHPMIEDLIKTAIQKLNDVANDCYGENWPIKNEIKPSSPDDLNRFFPSNITTLKLFVSDDPVAYTMYTLNNSETIDKEPVYRISEQNSVTNNQDNDVEMSGFFFSIQTKIEPFALSNDSHDDSTKEINLPKLSDVNLNDDPKQRPYVEDIDSTIVQMFTKGEIRRKLPSMTSKLKDWLSLLNTYYPGGEVVKKFISNLNDFTKNTDRLNASELTKYINNSNVKLPGINYKHCNGSSPAYRGYTCGLWTLFHAMTVKQAVQFENTK